MWRLQLCLASALLLAARQAHGFMPASAPQQRHQCQQQQALLEPAGAGSRRNSRSSTALRVWRSDQETEDFAAALGLMPPQEYKDITVVQAVEWTKAPGHGFVYIDVRCPEEHEEVVPHRDAINIPAFLPDGDWEDEQVEWVPVAGFVAEVEARFPKDTKLLVGCKAGNRSALACKRLVAAGFERLWNVESGSYLRTRQMGDDF